MMKAIYGVFERGVCLYVGATNNPQARFLFHAEKKFAAHKITCRIFRWVKARAAGRIEGEVIRAYKRLGQAIFNKRRNMDPPLQSVRELGKQILAGKDFTVFTKSERRMALVLAKGFGKRVHSRKNGKGFTIHVLE